MVWFVSSSPGDAPKPLLCGLCDSSVGLGTAPDQAVSSQHYQAQVNLYVKAAEPPEEQSLKIGTRAGGRRVEGGGAGQVAGKDIALEVTDVSSNPGLTFSHLHDEKFLFYSVFHVSNLYIG